MEFTLLWLQGKPHTLKDLQHPSYMDVMLLQGIGIYKDIIKECSTKLIEKGVKNVIDKLLECCRGISKAHGHDKGLKKAILHLESCFPFLPLYHAYKIVCILDV